MKKIVFLFLVFCITTLEAQNVYNFQLQECIEYALTNNQTLKIAEEQKKFGKATVLEQTSIGLPQISGNVSFTDNLQLQTSFLPDFVSPSVYSVLLKEKLLPDGTPIPAAGITPVQFGTKYNANMGISVSQMIYRYSFFIGLEASKTVATLYEKEYIQNEINVIENVSKAYYLVLSSRENLEILSANFRRIDSLFRETKLLYENGFLEKVDLNRLHIQHNNIRTQLKNNSELLITSISLLKFQMGMPIEEQLIINDNIKNVTFEKITEDSIDFDLNDRIEMQIFDDLTCLYELDIRNINSQYVPTFYINFNAGRSAGSQAFDKLASFDDKTWFTYANWGVTMNIPIFDGLYKRAKNQKNKVLLNQNIFKQEQAKININREIQMAKIKYENALRKMEVENENRQLAEEIFLISEIKYKQGVGSSHEVVEADTAFKDANNNYFNALYESIIAKIELLKSLGRLKNI